MKAILCRIAWMNKYNGKDEDKSYDPGGMNWEGKEKYCGEYWNFLPGSPDKRIIRGYVMIQAKDGQGNYTGTIDITKLGARPQDNFIDGVKVIFYAKNPNDGKNYVIGWYENATVLRNWARGDSSNDYRKDPQNNNEYYSFLTTTENAYLIEPEERNIEIPKASANNTGYPGQSNVFYGISNPEFVRSVISKLEIIKRKLR